MFVFSSKLLDRSGEFVVASVPIRTKGIYAHECLVVVAWLM